VEQSTVNVIVAACQQPLDQPLSLHTKKRILRSRTDFVCLPEHYPLASEIRSLDEAASMFAQRHAYLADLSAELHAVVVGGTLTEKTSMGFYNTCYVFEEGSEIGSYRKVHPTAREVSAGVLRGEEFKVFHVRGLTVGVLICADVLDLRSFEELASLGCRLAFVPTASPFRPGEPVADKFERDQSIFLEGARRLGCPVVKTCGVGATFGHPLQGRSLIATPERILRRAEPEQEQSPLLLVAELEV
jgi:predicted amidohydrolase